jgi:hypothetical protein
LRFQWGSVGLQKGDGTCCRRLSVLQQRHALGHGVEALLLGALPAHLAQLYSDEKVANRETKVWHFVIENGYSMMDKSKTPRHIVR